MKKLILITLFLNLFGLIAFSQNKIISGKIINENNEPATGATVKIKNSVEGTISDEKGSFKISVPSLPVVLLITYTGTEPEEITVNDQTEITVTLQSTARTLDPIVIASDRVQKRLLDVAVSEERAGKFDFINSPTDVYGLLLSKKGLDVTLSSITYKTYSTRGFNGSGSSRVNQLMDGMDNQAPGLNFSVGNFVGLTDLDVESVEILPGASSALYGPGGVNGTILINSKSPFKYPGLSVQVNNGLTDIGKKQRDKTSGYYDYTIRWAKNFNNKFAFKIGAQYLQANDWLADDKSNYLRSGTSGRVIPGNRQTDPNYDGVNVYGDETSIDVRQFVGAIASLYPAGSAQQTAILQLYNSMANPTMVSRTGYDEIDVIDPKTKNLKFNGALHYRFNQNLEAIIAGHWAKGNTVYTGNNRYSFKDINLGQYKIELKHKDWFLRGYTTQEDAGQAYSATITTQYFNEAWKPSYNPLNPLGSWYIQYAQKYIESIFGGANDITAHNNARAFADQGRPSPGSAQFNRMFDSVRSIPISKKGGLFLEKSQLWMGEGQYNFTDKIKFADVIVGGNIKKYILDSKGTLFIDSLEAIKINEWGAYTQFSKKFLNDQLTFSAAGRYDKNQNFQGKFTPRVTALINVAENNNIRLSYQTAYKFPTTQQQWIKLDVSTAMLLGGLPWILNDLQPDKYPTYIYDNGTTTPYQYKRLKPESMQSFEVGYKGLINTGNKNSADNKMLVDAYVYLGKYTDFLGRIVLVQPTRPVKPWSIVTNSDTKINTWGAGIGFDYKMTKNYFSSFNVSTDNLTNVPAGFTAAFNTPKYRLNAGFGNSGLGKANRIGFNVNLRWQDSFYWEGDGLADGTVKAYTTLDAQVNYRFPKIKSMIKVGGTNITNKYYRTGFGNPFIGGMYYVSLAYNIL